METQSFGVPGNDGGGAGGSDQPEGSNPNKEPFDCNICLDMAKDAVVTRCGHLFCWSCLVQWLDTRPGGQVCPVCKSAVESDQVIPIYGRGGSKEDPRTRIPPRPRGQRAEPQPQQQYGDGGLRFSLGIGFFPFGVFAQMLGQDQHPLNPQDAEDDRIADIFLYIGLFSIMALLLL
ncbi:unnamed protein product, partial [Mesorhabditis spiculigera]